MYKTVVGAYKRINKTQARRLYKTGQHRFITLCPVHLRPTGPWGVGVTLDQMDNSQDFDSLVNAFEAYNCINSETGRYAAYYVPWKWWNLKTAAAREFEPEGFWHMALAKYEAGEMEV